MENKSLLNLAMGVIFLGVSSLASAATPPDAGQTLQQLQSAPSPAGPAKPAPALINEATSTEPRQGESVDRIHVSRLVFRGNTVFTSEQLSRIAPKGIFGLLQAGDQIPQEPLDVIVILIKRQPRHAHLAARNAGRRQRGLAKACRRGDKRQGTVQSQPDSFLEPQPRHQA